MAAKKVEPKTTCKPKKQQEIGRVNNEKVPGRRQEIPAEEREIGVIKNETHD